MKYDTADKFYSENGILIANCRIHRFNFKYSWRGKEKYKYKRYR